MTSENNQDREANFVVCVPYGQQTVPSQILSCSFCGCEVALDLRNVEFVAKNNCHPVCMKCGSKHLSNVPVEECAGLVGGKVKDIEPELMERFKGIYKGMN